MGLWEVLCLDKMGPMTESWWLYKKERPEDTGTGMLPEIASRRLASNVAP